MIRRPPRSTPFLHTLFRSIEFIVKENATYINTKLKDLNFKHESLIATIVRENRTIIPSGDDILKPMDRVVVVTKNSNLLSLSGIFIGGGRKNEL